MARSCALLLSCLGAACSSDSGSHGAPSLVEVQIGRKGGRLELQEVTLQIPEGALDKDLKLSVREKADPVPIASAKALSKVYEFGPAGTKFNKDVEVHFKLERDEPGASVFFTKEERPEEFEKLATERDERGYVAKVKHFSAGFVGVDQATAADADAGWDAGTELDGTAQTASDAGSDEVEAAQPTEETGSADAAVSDGGITLPDGASGAGDAATASSDAGGGAPDAGSTPRVVLHTFDDVGTPANYTWAAFQDGNGAWQRLTPATTQGSYEFDVTSGRYGVAAVCADGAGLNSRGVVRFAAVTTVDVRIEIAVTTLCRVGNVPPMHTVYGPLTLPAGNYYYRYGHANASLLNNSMGSTNLIASGFPGGKLADLITGVSATQDGGLSRVIILRDLLLSDDLQRPFDFVNQGSDVGPTYSVLVTNASDAASIDVYYTSRREPGGMPLRQGATGTPSDGQRLLAYASIPAPLQRSDDTYLIVARESDANGGRELTLRANAPSNHDLALPAGFGASFNVETAPYLRPSMIFNDYPGATQYKLSWGFFPANEQHAFDMLIDAEYLETAGQQILTFPDFSGAQGFNPKWVPASDTTDAVNMGATVYTHLQSASLEQTTSSTVGGTYRITP